MPACSWTPATGLYYDNARWYDATNSVFISQDPIGFADGGTNLAMYCANSPTNYEDTSGMDDQYGRPIGPPQLHGYAGQRPRNWGGMYGEAGGYSDLSPNGLATGWFYFGSGWYFWNDKGNWVYADPQPTQRPKLPNGFQLSPNPPKPPLQKPSLGQNNGQNNSQNKSYPQNPY